MASKKIGRRVFLRFLSGGAAALASGGLLAGCGGGGNNGGEEDNSGGGTQTYNYPSVTVGGQTGSLTVTTHPGGAASGTLVIPAAVPAARPHVETLVPGTYVFTGTAASATGGFTVTGTATFTPTGGSAVTGPFTLQVTLPSTTTAGAFTATFNGGAITGTIPATGSTTVAQLGGAQAVLQVGFGVGVTGLFPPIDNPINQATFVPADVKITWNPGSLSADSIVEYHVYRDPPPTVLLSAFGLKASGAAFAALAPLPILSPASPLSAFDSIQDIAPLFVTKPDPVDSAKTVAGGFSSSSAFPLPLNQIPNTGLQIGQRVRYRIEALYKITDPTTGTASYALSAPAYTNSITYLQPVLLHQSVVGSYPNGNAPDPAQDPFGLSTGPNVIIVNVPTVYSGDRTLVYVLEFSAGESFNPSSTVRDSQTVPPNAGTETDPRNGPAISFGPIDLTAGAALTALGAFPAKVYVRIGVRDSEDPDVDASYVYTTQDSTGNNYPDLLPAQLTPGNPSSAARGR